MEHSFAILPTRIKAVVIDGIVVIAAMYAVSEIFALFNNVPGTFRIIVAVLILVFYDPFFTSFYGGTIGHTYSKISVRKEDDLNKNISFPAALIRFVVKFILGWLSLLTVTSSKKRMALHDHVANSVVINLE